MYDHEVSSYNSTSMEEPPAATSPISGSGDHQLSSNKIILGSNKCHGDTSENIAASGSSNNKLSSIIPDNVFNTKTESDCPRMIVTPEKSKGEICKHCNEIFPDHTVLVQHLIELLQDQSNIAKDKTENQIDDKNKTNGRGKSQESSNINVESVGKETDKSRVFEDEEHHITASSEINVDAGNRNLKGTKDIDQEITGDTNKCVDSRNKLENFEEMAVDNDSIISLEKNESAGQTKIAEDDNNRFGVENNDKSSEDVDISIEDKHCEMTVHSEININDSDVCTSSFFKDETNFEDRVPNHNKADKEVEQLPRNSSETSGADQKRKNSVHTSDSSQDKLQCYKCRICKKYFSSDVSANVHRLSSHSNMTQEHLFFKFTTGKKQAQSTRKEKSVINKSSSQEKLEFEIRNQKHEHKIQKTPQNDMLNDNTQNNATKEATPHVNLKRKLSQEYLPNKKSKIDKSVREIQKKGNRNEEKSIKLYKCPCGLHFVSYKAIQKHLKECCPANKVSKQECSKCGYLFTTDVLVNHLLKHHTNKNSTFEIVNIAPDSKKVYKCGDCEQLFFVKDDLSKHFSLNCEGGEKERAVAVKECSKLILNGFDVITVPKPDNNTKLDIISETKFDPILANKKPINPSEEIPDFTQLKTSKCLYQCRQCNLHYLTISSVKYHFEANHKSICKINRCEFCDLRFPQNTLTRHIKLHHGKRKHVLEDLNIIPMSASNCKEVERARYYSQQCSSNVEKKIKLNNISKSKQPKQIIIGTPKRQDKLILKLSKKSIDQYAPKQSKQEASKTPENVKCIEVIKKLCKKQMHLKSHEIKLYRCSLCSVHYMTKETLYEHILEADHSIQDSSKTRDCNTCGLKFDISTLPKHILAHHVQMNLKKEQFHIISKEPLAASFRSSSNPSRRGEFADVEFTGPYENVEKYLQSLPDRTNDIGTHYDQEMHDREFYNNENGQNLSDIYFRTGNCNTEYSDSSAISESSVSFDDNHDNSLLTIRKSNEHVEDDRKQGKSARHNMTARYITGSYPSTSKEITNISKNTRKPLETSIPVSNEDDDEEIDDDEENTQNENIEELSRAEKKSFNDSALFKCDKCSTHFMEVRFLAKHHKACRLDKITPTADCSTCGLKFTANSLAKHKDIHHNKMNLQLADIKISTFKPKSDVHDDEETDYDGEYTQNENIEELSRADKKSFNDNALFKCDKCSTHFMKVRFLAKHHKACRSDKITPTADCSTCGLKFIANSLAKHKDIHHNKMNLQLADIKISTFKPNSDVDDDEETDCYGEYTQNETKDLSQTEIISKALFKCDKCSTNFMKSNYLTNHMKACRSSNNFVTIDCSLCGLKFTPNSLASHKDLHHNKSQTDRAKLVKKIKNPYKHESYRKNAYNLTDKSYAKLKSFGNTVYKCRKCKFHFIKWRSYDIHMANCDPDKIVGQNCELCGLLFTKKSLALHTNIHHNKMKLNLQDIRVVCKKQGTKTRSLKRKHANTLRSDVSSNIPDQTQKKKRLYRRTMNHFNLTQTHMKKLDKKKLDNRLYRCDNCHSHFLVPASCKHHLYIYKCGKGQDITTRKKCNVCGLQFSIHSLAKHNYIHHEKMKLKRQDLKIINMSKSRRNQTKASAKLKKDYSSIKADTDLRVLLPKMDTTYTNTMDKKQATEASNSKILDNILYKCEECFVHYINIDDFKKHSCNPHDITGKDKCANCKLQFSKNSLLQHNYMHHDVMKLSLSDFTIISELPMTSEVQTNASKSHITDKPNLTPDKNKLTDKHKNKLKKPLVRKYNLSQKFIKALDEMNYDRRLYKCVKCSLHFLKRETLLQHSINGACGNGSANVLCSICGLSFTWMSLPKHEYIHHKKMKLQQNDFIIRSDDTTGNTKLKINSKKNIQPNISKPKVTPNVNLEKSNSELPSDNETENAKLVTHDKMHISPVKTSPSPTKVKQIHVNLEKGKATKIALDKSRTTLLRCSKCPLHFMSKSAYYFHVTKDKHSMSKVKCETCGLYFSSNVLSRHDIIHHKVLKLRLEDFIIVPPVTMPTVDYKNRELDSIKTETDNINSVEIKKEDNLRKNNDQNTQEENCLNRQKDIYQTHKDSQSKKIQSSRDKIKTALQMIGSSSESSDDDSVDDWRTMSSMDVDDSRRDKLEPSVSKLDKSNAIIDIDQDEVSDPNSNGDAAKQTCSGIIASEIQLDSKRQLKPNDLFLYKCETCQLCFINKSTWACHMNLKEHDPKKVSQCLLCHYTFSTKSLRQHKEIHHTDLKLRREDFKIISASNESKETRVPKSTTKTYVDDEISLSSDDVELVEESSNKTKLSKVQDDTLLKEKTHVVELLRREIASTSYSHPKKSDTIHDFKLFKCGNCNVCFIEKESLSNHIANHRTLDQKDYTECKLCGFQFLVSSLQEHIKVNHGKEFQLEKVLVTEWRREESVLKINTYYATEIVQSEQVSTTTDVAKDLVVENVKLTAHNSVELTSKAVEASNISVDEQITKEFV